MDLLSELQHAEFKEAFDEFDKVRLCATSCHTPQVLRDRLTDLYWTGTDQNKKLKGTSELTVKDCALAKQIY